MFNEEPKITRSTELVLQQAETAVANSYSNEITSIHILYGLSRVEGSVANRVLSAYGITANKIWKHIVNNINNYLTILISCQNIDYISTIHKTDTGFVLIPFLQF